jgi:fibronectin-binding autotransporter adhesin
MLCRENPFFNAPRLRLLCVNNFMTIFSARVIFGALIAASIVLPTESIQAVTRVWDGSTSGFWTNAANWKPTGAPANGDTLVFPADAIRFAMTNTIGAPSNFFRLEFSGSNYVLVAPAITLTNGITNGVFNSSNTLTCPIRIGADQIWTNTSRAVLILNSNINLNGRTLTFGSLGTFVINGGLTNSGNVIKRGVGFFNLNGTNTFAGTLTLNSGPLRVDGAVTVASLVLNDGTLTGNGSVNGFTAHNGSVVAAGDETTPGRLVSSAGIRIQAGATFDVELNGPVPGTDYDQLAINGTVDLGGATLVRSLGFGAATIGDKFLIIDNDGTEPITNIFAGLPEGAAFTNGTLVLQITYKGGTGNDVEIIARGVVGGSARTWSGLGTNGLWSNGSNWVGNVPPFINDQLFFPAGTPRLSNTNDLSADIVFNSITVSNNGYAFGGNPITLSGGFTSLAIGAPAVTFHCGLNLAIDQVFDGCCLAELNFNGPIEISGTVTFLGNARYRMNNIISGSGGIHMSGGGIIFLNEANTYSGQTTISSGTIFPTDSLGLGAPGGGTVISGGQLSLGGGSLTLPEPITLQAQLNNFSGTNTLTGNLTVLAGASLFVQPNTILILSNSLSGTNTLVKNGAGTLFMNGDEGNRPVNVNAGTLGGIGTCGPITVAAATLGPGIGAGVLTSSNVTLVSSSFFTVDLNGPAAGSGYDQLNVNGTVSLGNATLSGAVGFTPPANHAFVILNNDASDAVTGTFKNLPAGTVFGLGGFPFQIFYTGGDGNDVVLTRIRPAPGVITPSLTGTNVQLEIPGIAGVNYIVEASTNLINWQAISTNTAGGNGISTFTDSSVNQFSQRFFRVVIN